MDTQLTIETEDGHTRKIAGSFGAKAPLGVSFETVNEQLKCLNDGTLATAWKGGDVLGEIVDVDGWEKPPEEFNGWYVGDQR